ncbi:MAG: Coenzyme F420 hydrogenase/dehydrogenase, beta subunit C-terminal domain [Candidatus Bathyarchaeota archaeon]|nr:Coenzyme F420 hydrogenase/dehydrogenase, beta subunit C-terminal domain [Candidatus Bathyarchaeota archaeon]
MDPGAVTKFEIKNGRFYAHYGAEKPFRTRLSKVKALVRECCHHCSDFTSEFADISVGNVGSDAGWSTVIVRTERGEQAITSAEKTGLIELQSIENFETGESLVHRLSKMKKEQA